ncbi:hypothetical protein IDJ77_17260 [Mucilaginibacter sp. ZT4R22]|uniref:Restriction endonuclease n=1 Tax=Mucilaginibacter pankratovii TaxID=2772110 RepID=A0ABR7WWC4_9SPHI|nr:hypothetical protein [Mucilaginibacter pankratovii]MBD1365567.1 hypothetical protein [Mucilaginibacter pankratovii]
MNVKQIGEKFSQQFFESVKYFSDDYFLEADILIIDLASIVAEITNMKVFSQVSYGIRESKLAVINNVISERNEQIRDYLKKGGNLYVIISTKLEEQLEIIGTRTSNEVITFDYLSTITLNCKDFSIKSQKGSSINYIAKFKDFFSNFDNSYDFVFKNHIGNVIGSVAKSNQPTTLQIPVESGNIFLLQTLKTSADDLDDYLTRQQACKDAFVQLNQLLYVQIKPEESNLEPPLWLDDYTIGNEHDEIAKLKNLQNEKIAIDNQINQRKQNLIYYTTLKKLLYSTGKDLEFGVKDILKEIGYIIEPTNDGRDDLIFSFKGQVAVAEIKGVKGSAAEKHAAQLMKWVNNYHINHDLNPKGILIVNGFREIPLKDRIENTFPNQMLSYSRQQKICLVSTTQLLQLYLDFKVELITFNKLHKLLFNTIGILKYESTTIKVSSEEQYFPATTSVPGV